MTTTEFLPGRVPVASSLSIFDPVVFGADEYGRRVDVPIMFRNIALAGEPGAGKSGAVANFVAHGALATDCRLVLIDGKQVELGLWEEVADCFVGPDPDHANRTILRVQTVMDNRYAWLRYHGRRKIQRDDAFSAIMIVIDELAYFSATAGDKKSQETFSRLLRDLVARGRAVGIIVVAATQRPSSDIIPTSLRDLFAWRFAGRTTTDSSSDIILGHGWAGRGYTATSIDPLNQGTGLLLAEGGVPRLVKAAYLSDQDIRHLAAFAARIRRPDYSLTA
ncbi:FtsK/SpoIIIE domain-containing protein [Hamadaea tsunoensis]|uniref:FtsK/SpoIIIE domain-containing protein n=1 Tax=Hamadaea tsunoensis TaxID=53368 RepID=UPI0004077250|nr:FtsK/SpoIIIE domain-containing protein [Hamadaea tsunoensis]